MKVTRLYLLLILISLALTAVVPANGSQAEAFPGEWTNIDNQGSITRLVISREGDRWSIQAWGKCRPKDCYWGKVVLKPISTSVEDGYMDRGFAIWKRGFANTYVTLRLDEARMIAETITVFKDGSRRSDYRRSEVLLSTGSSAIIKEPASAQPARIFPRNEASLLIGRRTTVQWREVPGATSYGVEIDCLGCCERNEWCTDVGGKYLAADDLQTTKYSIDSPGEQLLRWRVWANYPDGRKGPKTDWWEFQHIK